MKQVKLGEREASVIAMGCMRLADRTLAQAEEVISSAIDCGVTLFDHADIYGKGQSEALFGQVLSRNPGMREHMILQSKCGICPEYYDMSYEHIMDSVHNSLRRLETDHLDILLFHRPDILAEEEEVGRAVQTLKQQGKVLAFGVSNMNPGQIRLLEQWTGEKMIADQLQLSLVHAGMVTTAINVNMDNEDGTVQDGGILPFCRLNDITLQAWSPLQYGMIKGCFIGDEKFPELNELLNDLASKYGVTPAAIALAWILRLPGRIQIVTGTRNPIHIKEACAADQVTLTRPEWYALYRACGYTQP